MRTATHAIVLATILASPLAAQVPSAPKTPSLVLPIELVAARPMQPGATWYQRRGLTPREFRVGTTLQLTGATWQPLRELSARTSLVNGVSVVEAHAEHAAIGMGKACTGVNSGWIKVYLQLRAVDPSTGKTHLSNIRGDSSCVTYPG